MMHGEIDVSELTMGALDVGRNAWNDACERISSVTPSGGEPGVRRRGSVQGMDEWLEPGVRFGYLDC